MCVIFIEKLSRRSESQLKILHVLNNGNVSLNVLRVVTPNLALITDPKFRKASIETLEKNTGLANGSR